jgi:hypothetical protein
MLSRYENLSVAALLVTLGATSDVSVTLYWSRLSVEFVKPVSDSAELVALETLAYAAEPGALDAKELERLTLVATATYISPP